LISYRITFETFETRLSRASHTDHTSFGRRRFFTGGFKAAGFYKSTHFY